MKSDAYPVRTTTVELVQTHVSWIFLTDTHAFKVKKPVNFGFLDFSTIDKRLFYCNEEVRLNRRLCPDIYEGVIALHETGDGATFTGNGPVIDHAVMMKRLPADRMLDKLVESGEATVEDMNNLANVISRFHAGAATSQHISEFGSLKQIMYNWTENLQQMLPFEANTLPPDERNTIQSWVIDFTDSNRELFSRRTKEGHIRECDGDLHLENICLLDGKVYIFDCIEFNERFRFCDTAADIAFLLMDLDFHNRGDLSAAVFTTYRETSEDREIEKLINFYKVYRAVIRGKVESFCLNDNGIDIEAKIMALKRAIRYFRLARGYCERTRLHPTLFITCGTMGCGKSTLAEQLAFELGISVHNSDFVRKLLTGHSSQTAVNQPYGQGLYDRTMTERTYAELKQLAGYELAVGRSVIIDASFKKAADRNEFAALATLHNADFIILMVTCDEDEQKNRLSRRAGSGISVSDGRLELLDLQKSEFEYPDMSEGRIITVNAIHAPEQLASQIYMELNRQ